MIRAISSLIVILGFSSAMANIQPEIPDPDLTPGELCDTRDPDFKEYRYQERIPYCERNVTSQRKNQIYREYDVPLKKKHNYTIDHFIPLSLGGDNSDENLWPEHKKIKELRKNLEHDTFQDLRDGYINQDEAIEIIIEAKLNPPIQVTAFENILY